MVFDLAQVITAIGGVIGAIGGIYALWTKYNQDAKNKKTEYEIEKLRTEDKRKNKKRSDNSMFIYGELWEILHTIKASRIFIIQPHPLGHEELLTISFEVKQKGITPMKPHIQSLKISDVPRFSKDLVTQDFIHITNFDEQVKDELARSILINNGGVKNAFVRKLSDNRHDWVGSLCCEYTQPTSINPESVKKLLDKTATTIQYILPEIEEDDYNK